MASPETALERLDDLVDVAAWTSADGITRAYRH